MENENKKEWKISEVDQLFDNAHFQARLEKSIRSAVFTRPMQIAGLILAAVGISSVGAGVGAFVHFANRIEAMNAQADALPQKFKDTAEKAASAAADAETSAQKAQNRATETSQVTNSLVSVTQAAASTISTTQATIEASRRNMAKSMGDLQTEVTKLADAADKAKATQKSIEQFQGGLTTKQETIDAQQQKLVATFSAIDKARTQVENLRQNTNDLASFKTFEFVTLRSRSRVNLSIKNVEPNGKGELEPVKYELAFTTHGLARPLNLEVEMHRQGEAGQHMRYEGIEVSKREANRQFYCICGTPFMFQLDNYIQALFVQDFATLKVVGRSADCRPPTAPAVQCSEPDHVLSSGARQPGM